MTFTEVDERLVNTIRTLAADIVAKSKSGHPGAPMGMAPMASVLFNRVMNFNPANPNWLNRDRFVLSNGHACALQYILLHLYGYNYSIEDLKTFRQLNSKCPGHPEAELEGVEVTTGPLGQGIVNAVGLAIAERHMAATFNRPGYELINNYTYCFVGDGCLMEGVASEGMALAGHLQLGKLIAFYDDNHITIDGDTDVAFTEDVEARVKAYGWHTLHVKNGDSDLNGILAAIEEAKSTPDMPTLIRVTTTIGYGSVNAGTHGVHGSPLKPDDIAQLKTKFGFDPNEKFVVPTEVTDYTAKKIKAGAEAEAQWNNLFEKYSKEYSKEASELIRRCNKKLPAGWEKALPVYSPKDDAVASRKLSETVLTKLYDVLPELIGGSADLTGSNLTRPNQAIDFQPPNLKIGEWAGRYVRYGVREHSMGAVMNGISAYGGLIPYGGTFLNFVSYAAGAVRLSALSGHQVIWVATHDSIGLGEDGPTHQPIETLAHFRAVPNLMVWRPADGNETSAAYKVALETQHTPSLLALSRQNLPQLEGSSIEKASKGGYVLHDVENPSLIIASTGSEVGIVVDAAKLLESQGHRVRVVSMPDFYTFDNQSPEYQLSVFPDGVPAMSVEVQSAFGWSKYTHEHFNLDHFGVSAPYDQVYAALEFTPEGVAKRALKTIEYYKSSKPASRVKHAFTHLVQTGPGPFSTRERGAK
ncbi:Transketolase 1 [Wickerhamiella sorbophila]|uniref:Transketolase n=1 Tax=Wickerhamiella sorbophila TaxID=45607 RepID=A0A2T0FMI1_9ASCO|nr:Transketolase 1 [Wickerhamiella sorbophila]PRT56186.1 Transketolase 1 [Wickerhamiella sorbophila]